MALTYSSYLKIDELLTLQQPLADEAIAHDEMLFIIIHQAYELWFKQILHELDQLQALLKTGDFPRAQFTLKRILAVLKVMTTQLDVLETMLPLDFLAFRNRLETASGFQSVQFRELEFVLGHKRRKIFDYLPDASQARQRLEERYAQPTLWDGLLAGLAKSGYPVPEEALHRDVRQQIAPSNRLQQLLIDLYVGSPQIVYLFELLLDLDQGFQEWRYRHVKMVERMIGQKYGTRLSEVHIVQTVLPRSVGYPHGVAEPMMTAASLYRSPNALAAHYRKFRVGERLLLTGHSHQAWPDCGLDGQRQAWLDAAEYLDHKWERAFAKAERVRRGFASLLDDPDGHIALGANTHEMVVRFLSALPLKKRRRLITTDGEFHSLRRQLDRLAEAGLEVVKVPGTPASQVAERLITAIDDRTAAVIVSAVFYQTGQIVHELGSVAAACRRVGAHLLVDAYHALNALPFSLKQQQLDDAFVTGGGYKYCQLGEGNAFLRFPPDCRMRPVVTGWFSEFDALGGTGGGGSVVYGKGPARFAGSTYDPTSHYRAAEVFDFFRRQGLSPELLREVSQHQIGVLAACFDQLDARPEMITRDRSIPLGAIGGFLVLRSPMAADICRLLAERGVHTDYRHDALRLGPAPYLSDDQLMTSMQILGEVLDDISGKQGSSPE